MRLATVSVEGVERIAAVINEEYIDLNKAYELLLESQGSISCETNCRSFYSAKYDWVSYKVEKKV